jgi:hypothetical protein
MNMTPVIHWPAVLLMVVPLGLLLLGAIVALALLLSNPKTRDGARTLLKFAVVFTALMIPLNAVVLDSMAVKHLTGALGTFTYRSSPEVAVTADGPAASVGQKKSVQHIGPTDEILRQLQQNSASRGPTPPLPPMPPAPPQAPKNTSAEKVDAAAAQAAATQAIGVFKTLVRVVGRALVVEGQVPAAKKDSATKAAAVKELPSAAGRGAGAEGSSKTAKPALTLTLSHGERGPDKRPAWVNSSPQLVGDAYQMSIAIGPYTTRAECDARLSEELQKALRDYVNVCLGDQVSDDVPLPTDILRQQLVKAQWEEVRQHSVGPMTWLHVLLQFDRKAKERILEEHRQAIISERLRVVARWAAIGLSLLTVAFGYLKIDLATGGAYRGRLRLVAAAIILGLIVVAVVAVLWGPVLGLGP